MGPATEPIPWVLVATMGLLKSNSKLQLVIQQLDGRATVRKPSLLECKTASFTQSLAHLTVQYGGEHNPCIISPNIPIVTDEPSSHCTCETRVGKT